MWMSVNYLLQLLRRDSCSDHTSLTIDVGGASTQIAFKPQPPPANQSQETELLIPNYNEYDIYSVSYLNYGNDLARKNVLLADLKPNSNVIHSPCYQAGYSAAWDLDKSKTITGTG